MKARHRCEDFIGHSCPACHNELVSDLADSKRRERKWRKAAKQWMEAHDKLKAKYEPMVGELSGAKRKKEAR